MKDSIMYIAVIMAVTLMLLYTVDYERKIEILQDEIFHQTDSMQITIDSLQQSLDSLNTRYQIFDSKPARELIDIINAISQVESNGNDSAYNASEDAVGCLQIRQCMVNDVNRILIKKGSIERYEYKDRWLRYKSIQMFNIYCEYYKLDTAEEIARCWNGGPKGMKNEVTVGYWEKVENQLSI